MTFKEKFLQKFNEVRTSVSKFGTDVFNDIKNIKTKGANKKIYITIAVLILVILAIILGVSSYKNNSKKELIDKTVNALESGNTKKLDNIVILNNGATVNNEQLIPVVRFFTEDKNRIETLKKGLESGKGAFSITMEKQNHFLYDNYLLVLKSNNLNIKTNIENTELFIDGNKTGVINDSKTETLLTPGIYTIRLENSNKYATLSNSKDVTLTKDEEVDLPLNGINISVSSNVDIATVYINDKSTETSVKDFKDIGPFPSDGSYNVSLKYKTPFGEVQSQSVPIKDMPEIKLDVDLKSSQVKTSLNNTIGKFYESVFSAIDLKDKSKIMFASEEAANEIYTDIKENGFILKNVYKLNSSSIDFDKSTIDFVNGVYDANIVANISYNVKKEILGVPVKSTDYEQKFFTKLKYENGKWQIYDVENFSLKTIN